MKTLLLCSALAFLSGLTIQKGLSDDDGLVIFVGVMMLFIVLISIVVSTVEGFG